MDTPSQIDKKHYFIVSLLTFVRAPLIIASGIIILINTICSTSFALLILALLLMMISAITDLFDGKYARKWNVTSKIGALADPLMDKAFYAVTLPLATFVALYNEDITHAVILISLDIISLVRDQFVTFLRTVGNDYGADIKAGMIGKVRTALGFPFLVLIHLQLGMQTLSLKSPTMESLKNIPTEVSITLEAVFLLLTIVSLIVYTKQYMPYLKQAAQIQRK